jgi:cytochrome c oxidase subunit 4
MATIETDPKTDAEHEGVHTHDEHHPTQKQYVQIAVVLAVLTAMEIAASFIDIGPAFLPTLIVLMGIKFLLVAGFFMHLRYDTRLYTRFMATGVILASFLYAVVLVIFGLQTEG